METLLQTTDYVPSPMYPGHWAPGQAPRTSEHLPFYPGPRIRTLEHTPRTPDTVPLTPYLGMNKLIFIKNMTTNVLANANNEF